MKKLVSLSILLFFIFTLSFGQDAKKKKNKKETRKERKAAKAAKIKNLINSKDFLFHANSVTSSHGYTRSLTTDYDIRISGDSTFSYLPYFGEAYRTNYGSQEGGIKFNDIMSNYLMNWLPEKKIYEISFEVIQSLERYHVYLSVSSSGFSTLKISSDNKQQIIFNGKLAF